MQLTLYSRPGCHLCEEMKRLIRETVRPGSFALEEVDIDRDPELQRRYGESIPVLAIDGKLAFKIRATPEQLREKLRRLGGES